MNTDKKEIVNEINNLTHQKYEIEQKLLTLQKQYGEIFKNECEQYIGKCYKQYIEDDDYSETVYYRVLDIYSEEDDFNYFWVLVVEDHDDDSGITASYIRKERINLLGRNKFFLRQLTPISEEEFNKALNDITDTIKQISKNIKDDKNIVLKCPKCNSIGPLNQGASMTTTVYYPPVWENGVNINPDGNITRTEFICEKCGCKFSARFKHGKCISIKEN